MTATTTVTIRPGRDWCMAEGHKPTGKDSVIYKGGPDQTPMQPLVPCRGLWVGSVFVCYACLGQARKT